MNSEITLLKQMLSIIEDHVRRNMDINDLRCNLEEELHYEYDTLNRKFRKATGSTIRKYYIGRQAYKDIDDNASDEIKVISPKDVEDILMDRVNELMDNSIMLMRLVLSLKS